MSWFGHALRRPALAASIGGSGPHRNGGGAVLVSRLEHRLMGVPGLQRTTALGPNRIAKPSAVLRRARDTRERLVQRLQLDDVGAVVAADPEGRRRGVVVDEDAA